jgi:phasin family protein
MNKESPMTSLPERLSVVRPQWEAQLDAFHTLGSRALDSAEQLLALNLKTSRASIEQVTGTWQQMLSVTHPRDLLNIGTQAQGQWQQVFSYSRELLGIAMGARPRNLNTIQMPMQSALLAAPLLDAPIADVVEQAAADSDAALAEDTMGVGDQSSPADDGAAGLPAAGQIEPSKAPAAAPSDAPTELDAEKTGEALSEAPEAEAVTEAPESAAPPPGLQAAALDVETSANIAALVDIVTADAVPPAKTKAVVDAVNELASKPIGAEHPLAATMPLENGGHIALPPVTPAESTPPVQLSNGPASERRRGTRKKS